MGVINSIENSQKRLDPNLLKTYYFENLPKHDTIWAMATGSDSRVYIGVCAEGCQETARLCRFDPEHEEITTLFDIADVINEPMIDGKIPQSKIHFSLCPTSEGKIYGATHCTAPPPDEEIFDPYGTFGDPRHGFTGGFIFEYDIKTEKTSLVGMGAPFEGVRCMVLDSKRRICYGVTYPRVHLFKFELDSGISEDLGRIGELGAFDLFLDNKGRVFGTNDYGLFYCYDPEIGKINDLDMTIPGFRGKQRFNNFLFYPVHGPDGRVYASTYYNGHIFSFDLTTKTVIDLGMGWGEEVKGDWMAPIAMGLVFGASGALYYSYRRGWEPNHLVRYDLVTGEKKDLGIVAADNMTSGAFGSSVAVDGGETLLFGDITMNGAARIIAIKEEDLV